MNLNSELEEYTKPKIKKIKLENLSPEDSVKRLRRRERNKIAATKCRNKKKARTHNLMKVCICIPRTKDIFLFSSPCSSLLL